MTPRQRAALLALPDTEELVVHHHGLDAADLAAVGDARTPETRLSYALQLCALRYPGRHLRRSELLPAIMLDHIAEQIGVDAGVIAAFARRAPTRYDQLAAIKRRFGYRDLTHPLKAELKGWLAPRALTTADARDLLQQLVFHMRAQRIVIPGVSVVERLAAEAMHAADARAAATITGKLTQEQRKKLDALVNGQARAMQSRLSWLRAPDERIRGASLAAQLDKLELLQDLGLLKLDLPTELDARCRQMAREGERYTAQAFQQISHTRRYAVLTATLRVLEVSITDAALSMFRALVGRATLRARKRVEAEALAAAEKAKERLRRIANVLDAMVSAAEAGADIAAAVVEIAPLKTVTADSAALRRSMRGGKLDYLDELGREHRVFRRLGPRLLDRIELRGGPAMDLLLHALSVVRDLGGDGRRPLPSAAPIGHIEPRWRKHVFQGSAIDRTYYELATYFGLASALGCGDVWAPASRLHRAVEDLIGSVPTPTVAAAGIVSRRTSAERYLEERSAMLDAALRATAHGIAAQRPALFDGGKLRFPRPPASGEDDPTHGLAARAYRLMPKVRVTDLLEEVDIWTGFSNHFGHVSTELPPKERRTLLATLIAEATNLGLSRMADVCGVASRRTLLRMLTWHLREETLRSALACLTDAIHAEPLAAWFGEGWRANADGQAYYLGGPGDAGGSVNAHYGRDPIVKIYTTVTDRYAPLGQTLIAGTASEAVHALDALLGHASDAEIRALHTDGGGVSDMVFAVTHLLGLDFEPRIPRLSDRRLYAFEAPARYGALALLFGQRLNRELIATYWDEIGRVVEAIRNRTVTPSLILKKLSAYRQQNGLAAALREIGRIERTLFTLRWFESPVLRKLITAELNKGEALNTLRRAVALHRLGRFRDRSHENQASRAATLNLVVAAIVLFNCRYLSRVLDALQSGGGRIEHAHVAHLSPLGWDHINLTGDYVWSDSINRDPDGFLPLRINADPGYRESMPR
jgi:TnpA family transposase